MMRWSLVGALAVALMALGAAGMQANEVPKPTGKDVFLKYKCRTCHGVEALKIAVKKDEDEDEDDEEGKEPPDLSAIGLERKAPWLKAYLLKKQANEDGDKHKKKFRGTAEELKLISEWLAELKTDPKAKKKK